MCTALTYNNGNHYFGRNLDLEYSYCEAVTIAPRNFLFQFHHEQNSTEHYAMIGIATVVDDYPLYYDATNEVGLSAAGLNFPGNAVYFPPANNKRNIAPYELIPWILGKCRTVTEAEKLLKDTNITDIPFSREYPLTPLHWIFSDRERSITVEQTQDGLRIYQNHVGILTNNPPFDFHIYNLQNYANLNNKESSFNLSGTKPYSRGLGTFGLPGDLTSASRFVRAAFIKYHSVSDQTEDAGITQFFHILGSVEQQEGCVKARDGFVKTVYSSCCNTDTGIYYYTTYENRQITGVDMNRADLNSDRLQQFSLIRNQKIYMEN